MFKIKSARRVASRVFSCFMSVVLVAGLSVPGSLVAYADDGAVAAGVPEGGVFAADAPEDVADEVAVQEGEQNYAVLTTEGDVDTLTFYWGTPAGTAGADYFEGYDTTEYTAASQRPWSSRAYTLDRIVFDSSLEIPAEGDDPAGSHLAPTSTAHWFEGCYWVSEVEGLNRLDTSNVTNMERMFYSFAYQQHTLTTLDLSGFDTSSVTNMKEMFFQASAFTAITLGRDFDTSQVTDMSEMFRACTRLESLTFPDAFDTGSVTTMAEMFSGCSNLTSLDVSKFRTQSVTDMSSMFFNCTKLESIDFTQDGETTQTFNTSNVTTMEAMFTGCRALQTLSFPNTFDTSNVTTMKRMFQSCVALTNPGVSAFNTAKVETFYQMFEHCESLSALDLSSFSTTEATALDYMFLGCTNMTSVTFGDDFKAQKVRSMHSMFEDCKKLTSVDLSNWATLFLEDMSNAFYNCTALTQLNLSTWTTPVLRSLNVAFKGCTNLVTLDLSGMNTSRVTTFYHIFDGCSALNSVTFGQNFNGKALAASSRDEYWCMLPTPPATDNNNGLWWKDGAMSYTPDAICDLTGDDIAGTWTWSHGVAVMLTSTEGGTVTAKNASGVKTNTGDAGSTVTLTATPDDSNYEFTSWTITSGDGTGEISNESADSGTGVASATFTFGSENGAVTATFKDKRRNYDYRVGALSQTSFTYNDQMQVPSFTVRDSTSDQALTAGMDYTVSYKQGSTSVPEPTQAGTYGVYIKGAANYGLIEEREVGEFTINAAYNVSGTLACASGWTPAGTSYNNWGSLRVMRPVAGSPGDYELVETQWPAAKAGGSANNAFSLSYVEPGSKIIFTPQTPSACSAFTYEVGTIAGDVNNVVLTAPYANGIVEFSGLNFVAADRLYDPITGANYTKDNDEATRTTPFALDKNSTRVTAVDGRGNSVPVYVVNGKSLLIQDEPGKLVAGAKYTLTLNVCDPVFRPSYGTFDIYNTYAATKTVEVTLGDISEEGSGSHVGAAVGDVTVRSQGRAVIHCANPGKARVLLFLYDGQGNLAGSKRMTGSEGTQVQLPLIDGAPMNYASNETAISLPFMDAGNYTICAVERDAYGAATKKNNLEADTSAAPETLAELKSLGLSSAQLAEQTFTVQDNTLTDIGVTSPFSFPTPSTSDVIDFAKSSVTMSNSYSRFATITVTATLQDGVDATALSADKKPTLRIYTNQKQPLPDTDGAEPIMWPQSLSINGKPVHLGADYAKNRGWKMLDGWLYLDLADANLNPGYKGVDSFPLTVSLTVPRSDFSRSYACAYLQLANVSNFIASCDEAAQDISLVAPQVTADKTFTAQGYTAAKADVALYLDGVPAATVKSDAYGYYAAKLAFPENVEDPTIFDVQATATWESESKEYSASSEVLDVTYSTTKPSLKRLWMLIQTGQRGTWDYMLVYDNGEWTSMYKSYLMTFTTTPGTRRYVWIAEFNNADYARNVKCVVPRSDGDTIVPTTRDYEQADAWLSLSNPGSKWYTNTELDVQAGTDPVDLASLDVRGKLDYRDAASVFTSSLQSGNAFVSEPAGLSYPPSGVYVTFDEVERQTLAQAEAFTGPAGLDSATGQANVANFITAVNHDDNKYLAIVNKDPDAEGNLVKVDSASAAAAAMAKGSGTVDEWIAVSIDGDSAMPVEKQGSWWLQLHHTVTTSTVDMTEPVGMITAAQGKYAEYLGKIQAAVEAGHSANDAEATLCPCKVDSVYTSGIPIQEMVVRSDNELDSMRYFIWAEDTNRNSYVRTMERYEIQGTNAVAYRQYEAHEKKLTITEWNGQTNQKTVLSYELADSFVNRLAGGQHDTDFEGLMDLWMYIGGQVQLGLDDAVNRLADDPSVNIAEAQVADECLANQSGLSTQEGNTLRNFATAVGPLGWAVLKATTGENPDFANVPVLQWIDKAQHWREETLKKAGLITDWGSLSDSELQSLFQFIWKNKTSCLEIESKIQKSNSGDADPYGAAKAAAFRGGLKRVYDTVEFAKDFGIKFHNDGVAKAVGEQVKSYLSTKTEEAYRNYVYNERHGHTEDILSKYSDEYIELVRALIDFEKRAYENGNPNGYPQNCIDWSAIPDDLIFELKYAEDNKDIFGTPERLKRLQGIGSLWPKGKHDPSGIVYEGMLSNPVAGATVKLYEYDPVAGASADDYAVLVDSELFGYEPNPQVTDEDGRYQWFVNEGFWQVRVTKGGYTTKDGSKSVVSTGDSADYGLGATKTLTINGSSYTASTYWMPVLPEQIDVNIPLWSTEAPVLESVEGTAEGVLVTFSKPMKVDTVDASMFTVALGEATDAAPAGVEAVDEDVAADGSKASGGDEPQMLARTFLLKYPSGQTPTFGAAQTVTATFANGTGGNAAVSYADTAAENGNKASSFTVENELDVQSAKGRFTYNGAVQTPSADVKDAHDASKSLAEGTDYVVTYKMDGQDVDSPIDAGSYTMYVTGIGDYASMGTVDAGSFTIAKLTATITAANQKVFVNKEISSDVSKVTLSGAATGHSLKSVALSADTSAATTSGAITPYSVLIQDASGAIVNSNYDITFANGTLTVVDHYTVRYNLNGGAGIAPAQDTDAAGEVTLNGGSTLSRAGYRFAGWNALPDGRGAAYAAGGTYTLEGDLTLYAQWAQAAVPSQAMHRLYNHWSGEHFYTASDSEKNGLVALGWTYEGVGWNAPVSGADVHRLYNRWTGDHHFTTSAAERDQCVAAGWTYEGVGWKSGGSKPVYREYNPYAPAFYHNYTASAQEHAGLIAVGWHDEGIGWYGV